MLQKKKSEQQQLAESETSAQGLVEERSILFSNNILEWPQKDEEFDGFQKVALVNLHKTTRSTQEERRYLVLV